MTRSPPNIVLCFSGHDPSGGAGVQADIEAILHHRAHACSIITALTEQDSHNVRRLLVQKPEDVYKQASTLLNDIKISAFKIGLLGHYETAQAVHAVLQQYPAIPVVFDPVLAAGGGSSLADEELITAIRELLLPCTTLLTPNSQEARILATDASRLEQCGLNLLDKGCDYVLITGTHEQTGPVINQLFFNRQKIAEYSWERLPHSYHGSGCTLAASIAALLARGLSVAEAVARSQEFTWRSLQTAFKPGHGQYLPDRG